MHICARQGAQKIFLFMMEFLRSNLQEDLVKLIVNMKNREGNTPLLEAWLNQRFEFIKLMQLTLGPDMLDETIENNDKVKLSDVKKLFDIEMMKMEMAKL